MNEHEFIDLDDLEAERRTLDGPPVDEYAVMEPGRRRARDNVILPDIREWDVSRWVGLEPPKLAFTIDELVPHGMVTLLVSEGGAGKSLLLQQACTVTATEHDFLGKPTMKGSAVGVFAEDPGEVLHVRQARITASLGIEMDALIGRVAIGGLAGYPATLWRDGRPTPFLDQLQNRLSDVDNLRLLTLDNAALLYGGNENERGEVTAFLNRLNGMAADLGVAIILSHHRSKSYENGTSMRAASGSTAWINSARCVLDLEPERENEPARLRVAKANHTKPGQEIGLEWRDGVLVAQDGESDLVKNIRRRTSDRVFLDLLSKVRAEGRDVSDSPNAGNYAPRLFAGRPDNESIKAKDFKQAMERLFFDGRIRLETYGRKHDERKRIVPAKSEGREK